MSLSTLKQVMKDPITCNNIDVATITEEGYKLFTTTEVEEALGLLNCYVCWYTIRVSVTNDHTDEGVEVTLLSIVSSLLSLF